MAANNRERRKRLDASVDDGSFGKLVTDDHIDPNCVAELITIERTPHVCIFANREVSVGQQHSADQEFKTTAENPDQQRIQQPLTEDNKNCYLGEIFFCMQVPLPQSLEEQFEREPNFKGRNCDIIVDQEGVLDYDCQIEINRDWEAFLVPYGRIPIHLKHNDEFFVGRRKFIWEYPYTEDVQDISEAEDCKVIIIQEAKNYSNRDWISEVNSQGSSNTDIEDLHINEKELCDVDDNDQDPTYVPEGDDCISSSESNSGDYSDVYPSISADASDLHNEKELCDVDDNDQDPTYVPEGDDCISSSESNSGDNSDVYPSVSADASDINVRSALQIVSTQSQTSGIEIAASDNVVVEPRSNKGSDDLHNEKELCDVDDSDQDPTYVPEGDDCNSSSESNSGDNSDVYPSVSADASDINVRSALQIVSAQSQTSGIEIAASDNMVVEPSSNKRSDDLHNEKELCDVDDIDQDSTYVPEGDDCNSGSESNSGDYSDVYPSVSADASDINVRSALQIVSTQSQTSGIEIVASDNMVVEPSSNKRIDAKLQRKGYPQVGHKKKYDKMNACTFCKKIIHSKITRHLLTHSDRAEILKIRMLPKRSEERAAEFAALVNEGNYKHNIAVLKSNKGTLITMRRESADKSSHSVEDYYPCEFCKGFCLKRLLWHHAKNCKVRKLRNGNDSNFLRNSRTLLYSALLDNEDQTMIPLFERMNDGEVKRIVAKDMVIKKFSAIQIAAIGDTSIQKKNDIHRVSQNIRTLGRLVIEARKEKPTVFLSALLRPESFDLVVRCVCRMSEQSLTLGPRIGHLIGHCIMTKSGWAIRNGDDQQLKEANEFKTLFDAEWKYVVNAVSRKKKNSRDLNKLTVIPETQDLVKLRNYLVADMKDATDHLSQDPNAAVFQWLGKITLCRLLLFNKRRVAEVEDMTVESYTKRPEWRDTEEFQMAMTQTEKQLAKRMDMVECLGKSKKNQKAYVLITPETKKAIEMLIGCREAVGVPEKNKYLFARLNANTPLSGSTAMREVCIKCTGLNFPERITSTNLRKYVATVSQILDMTSNELRMLAKHMGHDVKTHKEYYQLSSATQELSKVSRMLTAVECGHINTWKDRPMSEIKLDDLPYPESDEGEDDVRIEIGDENDTDKVLDVDDENPQEDVNSQTERNGHLAHKRRIASSDEEPPAKTFKKRDRTEDDDLYDEDDGYYSKTHPKDTTYIPATKRGMKKRWTDAENYVFLKYFEDDIKLKKMPLASKLQKAKSELNNRTILQIRTKVNNIILGKQKIAV